MHCYIWGVHRAPCCQVLSELSFRNICPHPSPCSPPCPTRFHHAREKKNLCSLCWLIKFRFTVLILYHAHTGNYEIRFYVSHGSSFWGPKSEKEFNTKKCLCFLWLHKQELQWIPLGRIKSQVSSWNLLSWPSVRGACRSYSRGEAVTITPILWRPHSRNWENNPCKTHRMISEPGKTFEILWSNPLCFTGEETEVQRDPHSY